MVGGGRSVEVNKIDHNFNANSVHPQDQCEESGKGSNRIKRVMMMMMMMLEIEIESSKVLVCSLNP